MSEIMGNIIENSEESAVVDSSAFIDPDTVYINPGIGASLYFADGMSWYKNSRTILVLSPARKQSLIIKSLRSQLIKISFSIQSSCAKMQSIIVQGMPFELLSKVTDVSFYMVVIQGNNPILIETSEGSKNLDDPILVSEFKIECLSEISGIV